MPDDKEITDSATQAALYFRTLTEKGVPERQASDITSAWILARDSSKAIADVHKEDWEKD